MWLAGCAAACSVSCFRAPRLASPSLCCCWPLCLASARRLRLPTTHVCFVSGAVLIVPAAPAAPAASAVCIVFLCVCVCLFAPDGVQRAQQGSCGPDCTAAGCAAGVTAAGRGAVPQPLRQRESAAWVLAGWLFVCLQPDGCVCLGVGWLSVRLSLAHRCVCYSASCELQLALTPSPLLLPLIPLPSRRP